VELEIRDLTNKVGNLTLGFREFPPGRLSFVKNRTASVYLFDFEISTGYLDKSVIRITDYWRETPFAATSGWDVIRLADLADVAEKQ
jgi:hypothetical protein